jgi:deglycase
MSMNTATASSQPGRKVAILVTDGFEQVELTSPRDALQQAGAQTTVISPQADSVQGFNHDEKADRISVDLPLSQARADDFDLLVLPGGVLNADTLRTEEAAQAFVRAFDEAGKPIAVICHGAWLLIDAGLVQGRTLTSWPSLATDLRNAGATWVDQEVCVDGRWISSRKPDDLPAFNARLLECVR